MSLISLIGCAAAASHARRVVSITRAAFADIARCARLESGVVSVMWTSCRPEHCNYESFSLTRENLRERVRGRSEEDEQTGSGAGGDGMEKMALTRLTAAIRRV
jgi:hypothetical protein